MIDFEGILRAAVPDCKDPAGWNAPLQDACTRYKITSSLRIAAFLAQVGHESGGFNNLSESLNYSATALRATFPSRVNKNDANKFGRTSEHPANQEAIAELVYGGRMGNVMKGDGYLYRGAGLVQLTGFENHNAFAIDMGMDTHEVPAFLRTKLGAALSAAWYWNSRALNSLADTKQNDEIGRRINGAKTIETTNGLADRRARYDLARKVLGI